MNADRRAVIVIPAYQPTARLAEPCLACHRGEVIQHCGMFGAARHGHLRHGVLADLERQESAAQDLALGNLDADGLRMLGISASDPVALALDGTPGRGICVGFAGDPRPSVCQVAWLDQERARAEVRATYYQGLHLIQPSTDREEAAA